MRYCTEMNLTVDDIQMLAIVLIKTAKCLIEVVRVRMGYKINLPKPILLD